jgi:branched-chain amino acid transport system ATP-binding protein
VILLDEPSSGIAQRESEALAQVLKDLRDSLGAALVVIEHDIPLVSSIAEEMVCLHLGHVIARGTPREVLDHPEVVASYLGTDPAAIERSGRRARRGSRSNGEGRRGEPVAVETR